MSAKDAVRARELAKRPAPKPAPKPAKVKPIAEAEFVREELGDGF